MCVEVKGLFIDDQCVCVCLCVHTFNKISVLYYPMQVDIHIYNLHIVIIERVIIDGE